MNKKIKLELRMNMIKVQKIRVKYHQCQNNQSSLSNKQCHILLIILLLAVKLLRRKY